MSTYFTSPATSRALRDAGLPQDAGPDGAVWLLENTPFLSRGISPQVAPPPTGEPYQWARAFRLDELLAELAAAAESQRAEAEQRSGEEVCVEAGVFFTSHLCDYTGTPPGWCAYTIVGDERLSPGHASPVEAVAALVLAVRGEP